MSVGAIRNLCRQYLGSVLSGMKELKRSLKSVLATLTEELGEQRGQGKVNLEEQASFNAALHQCALEQVSEREAGHEGRCGNAPPARLRFFEIPLKRNSAMDEFLARDSREQEAEAKACLQPNLMHLVYYHAPQIEESIERHDVVCVADIAPEAGALPTRAAGSGKSSQVCQIILHAEAQKRRGSVTSILVVVQHRNTAEWLAKRIAAELGECKLGLTVGCWNATMSVLPRENDQRFAAKFGKPNVKCTPTPGIIITTYGELERWQRQCHSLPSFSHVILDDIHERTSQMDFLLTNINRKVFTRNGPKVKLVLLSSTSSKHVVGKLEEFFRESGRSFDVVVVDEPLYKDGIKDYYLQDLLEHFDGVIDNKVSLLDGFENLDEYNSRWHRLEAHVKTDEADIVVSVSKNDYVAPAELSADQAAFERRLLGYLSRFAEATPGKLSKQTFYRLMICRSNRYRIWNDLLAETVRWLDNKYREHPDWAIHVVLPGFNEIKEFRDLLIKKYGEHFSEDKFEIIDLHSILLDGVECGNDEKLVQKVLSPAKEGRRKLILSTKICDFDVPDRKIVVTTTKNTFEQYNPATGNLARRSCLLNKAELSKRRGWVAGGKSLKGKEETGVFVYLGSRVDACDANDAPEPQMETAFCELHLLLAKLYCEDEDFRAFLLDLPAFVRRRKSDEHVLMVMFNRLIEPLRHIRALDAKENLTHLGEFLAKLGIDPRLGLLLLLALLFGAFDPILTIVVCLMRRKPFVETTDKQEEQLIKERKRQLTREHDFGDHMLWVRVYNDWRQQQQEGTPEATRRAACCAGANFLSEAVLLSIVKEKKRLIRELESLGCNLVESDRNAEDPFLVNAILAAGLCPNILQCRMIETNKGQKLVGERIQDGLQVSFQSTSIAPVKQLSPDGSSLMVYYYVREISNGKLQESSNAYEEDDDSGTVVIFDGSQVRNVLSLALLWPGGIRLIDDKSDGTRVVMEIGKDGNSLDPHAFSLRISCPDRELAELLMNTQRRFAERFEALVKPENRILREELALPDSNIRQLLDNIGRLISLPRDGSFYEV